MAPTPSLALTPLRGQGPAGVWRAVAAHELCTRHLRVPVQAQGAATGALNGHFAHRIGSQDCRQASAQCVGGPTSPTCRKFRGLLCGLSNKPRPHQASIILLPQHMRLHSTACLWRRRAEEPLNMHQGSLKQVVGLVISWRPYAAPGTQAQPQHTPLLSARASEHVYIDCSTDSLRSHARRCSSPKPMQQSKYSHPGL